MHESGGTVVPRVEAADVIHLTLGQAAAVDALPELFGTARCVVLHDCPAALEPAEIGRLAARAEATGTVVAVPFVHRYYPMVRLARRRVRSGAPGPLHMVHGWATPDAVMAWLDLLQFISRHRVRRVVATGVAATPPDSRLDLPDSECAAGMLFETDRGAVGTLAVSQGRPVDGGTLLLALDGVEESLVFHEGRPEVLDVMGRLATQRFHRGVGADVSRYSTQQGGHPQGHRDCWTSFVADAHSAAEGRSPDGLPTLVDLLHAASLVAALHGSHETDTWAAVGPQAERQSIEITEGTTA